MTHDKLNALGLGALIVAGTMSVVPVLAQVDLSGSWARRGQTDNSYSQETVDLLGMPLSEDEIGRAHV